MAAASSARRAIRPLAVAAAAAFVFLAGMAARGAVGDGEAGGTQAVEAVVADGRDEARAAPSADGFARSREGARAAAIEYTAALAQRLLYLELDDAEMAVRAIASEASRDSLASEVTRALAAVREPLAGGTGATWWVAQPLAAKIDAYSSDRARVSVWLVRVLSRTGVVVPQSSWLVETVDLVWERDDWRLWSSTSTPGPSPVLDGSDMPASAVALDATLAGFELLDPAVAGR